MTVGTYVNRKSGNTVNVVEVDEKTKTLIYEGADGKTHATSWSSFRKSYKDATATESVSESEITADEKTESVESESVSEVDSEKEKSDEPKKEKKKGRVRKEKFPVWDEIISNLDSNSISYKIVGKRIKLLNDDGKTYGYLRANSNNSRLYIKESVDVFQHLQSVGEIISFIDNGCKTSNYNKVGIIEYANIASVMKEVK